MRLLIFLIRSLVAWLCQKDLYYEPYKTTVVGEHYENKKTF